MTCGSDIYALYKMCLYCHRTKLVEVMRSELKKRSYGSTGCDLAVLYRREAWQREREAKRTKDAKKREALMELVSDLRGWAEDEDEDTLADQAPVPIIDRVGRERG